MENRREEIVKELIKSGKSCIIYGTGKFGICVAEYLLKNNIDIFCFCDSDNYYYEGKKVVIDNDGEHIFNVINEEELQRISSQYNILLGMIDYSLMTKLKNKCSQSPIVDYLDVVPEHIMDLQYVEENKEQLTKVYHLLEDEESRKVMESFVFGRLTGNVEELSKLNKNPEYTYDYGLLNLHSTDVVVDGGAYVGDTILEIQRYVKGNVKNIFAFEPDSVTFEKLSKNIGEKESIHLVNAGLWKKTSILRFENSGTLGSKLDEDAEAEIKVVSLDDYNEEGILENVTIIKMDIEGSELDALKGAENLLREEVPKLAICIYHKNEDIFSIPLYIASLNPKLKGKRYKFYLRQHSFSVEETVLYAIPADI